MSACCSPDHSCTTQSTGIAVVDGPATTVYQVAGMSCGNCRAHITEEVSPLAGVLAVEVDVAGGTVTVTTTSAPDHAKIAAAIEEAGYQVTGRAA